MRSKFQKLTDKINAEYESDVYKPLTRKKNEALYQKLLTGKLDHLTDENRRLIEPILKTYVHLFHEQDNRFKCTNVMEH